jgi:uncharacterized OsmC-like protein
MKVSARIINQDQSHNVTVSTDSSEKTIAIAAKANGTGSSVNGAELLLLSIATCYCNDIYREAARRNITVRSVEVTCMGEFGEAIPGKSIRYSARVDADASAADIADLVAHTDEVAEIHQTLRKGVSVTRAT